MADVHVRYLDTLERAGGSTARSSGCPPTTSSGTGQAGRRAHNAGVRGRAGLHQDRAVRRAARLGRARRTRSSAGSSSSTSPRCCAAATRTRSASTRCAARSSRRGSRTASSTGQAPPSSSAWPRRPGWRRPTSPGRTRRPGRSSGCATLWAQIAALDDVLETDTQIALLLEVRRLAERATRWLLRNRAQPLDIAATTEFFRPGVRELAVLIPTLVTESPAEGASSAPSTATSATASRRTWHGRSAALPDLISALDITTVARSTGGPSARWRRSTSPSTST